MIKDLPPPTEAEEYRNTVEILRDWLLKFGLAEHATNFSTMPIISIGWPSSSSSHLKLPLEGFGPVSKGSV